MALEIVCRTVGPHAPDLWRASITHDGKPLPEMCGLGHTRRDALVMLADDLRGMAAFAQALSLDEPRPEPQHGA